MKRILFVLLDVLSIALLAGGYIIQYFTKRKLGMLRWVIYTETKIKEMMPVDILKYSAALVAVLLTVILVRSYLKKRKSIGSLDRVMIAFPVILAVLYLGCTLLMTSEVTRAYYLVLPLIGASTLVQLIRSGIAVWMCKDEK